MLSRKQQSRSLPHWRSGSLGSRVPSGFYVLAGGTITPVLSGAAVASITFVGGTPSVNTDVSNGTGYMVVVPNADTPSVAQIKAGQQSSGAAAIDSESVAVSSGTITFAATNGCALNTDYDVWIVQTSAASVDSLAVKADFPTGGYDATQNAGATGVTSLVFTLAAAASNVSGVAVGVSWSSTANTLGTLTYGATSILANLHVSQDFAGVATSRIYKTTSTPDQGSQSVRAVFSGAVSVVIGAISVVGGNIAAPFTSDSTVKATATSTTPSVSCATSATELVMDNVCYAVAGGAPTVGASQTQRWAASGVSIIRGAGSTQLGSVENPGVMSWTIVSAAWGAVAASFGSA